MKIKPGHNILNRRKILFFSCIILGIVFLALRAPYGYCFNDEPFIVTLGQRLSYGDSLIFDEWHVAQTVSPIIAFFYKIYVFLHGSTEGILLAFRYIYILIWISVCSSMLYFFLNNKYINQLFSERYLLKDLMSISVFFYLVLFSPLDYMTLSYTSLGLSSVLVITLFLFHIPKDNKTHIIFWNFLGIFVSLSVLCCPWMALFYIVLFIFAIFYFVIKGRHQGQDISSYIIIMIVVIAMMIIYCGLWIFYNNNISEFVPSLKMVFDDAGHTGNVLDKILTGAIQLYKYYKKSLFIYLTSFFVIMVFNKYLTKVRLFVIPFSIIGFVITVYTFSTQYFYSGLNYQMINIIPLGFLSFFMLKNKPWKAFVVFMGTGIIYAISSQLSSDTKLKAISMALSVCGVGAIFFIFLLLGELFVNCSRISSKFITSFVFAIVICIQIGVQFITRIERQYWDSPPLSLNETITVGAARGLKTTKEKKESYEHQYNNLTALIKLAHVSKDKQFVSFHFNPVLYLDASLNYGTFSAWDYGYSDDELYHRYSNYYAINKSKKPEVVFCFSDEDVYDWFDTKNYSIYEYSGSKLFVLN